MRRLLVPGAVAVVVGALLVAVLATGPGAGYPAVVLDGDRPRPQGDFYRGPYPEPATLNPFTAADATARRVAVPLLYDALLDRDPADGALRPALALAVDSDDGIEHRVTLRAGCEFADGTPVTAEDFAFTWQMAQEGVLRGGPLGVALRDVVELDVDGEHAFRFRLAGPAFAALPRVACEWRVVSARHWRAAGADGLAAARDGGPATGPLHLREPADWVAGERLTLVQNPHCWRRAAQPECWNLAGMRLRFIVDRAAQLAALRAGAIDWFADDDLDALLAATPELGERFALHRYAPLHLGPYLVLWNHRHPPLDRADVRRALALLFDRAAIAGLLGGGAVPAASWFRPGSPAARLEPVPFDPARARELLATAGVEGLRLELLVAADRELFRRIADLAAPAFAAAGVELRTVTMDFATILERCRAGEFEATLLLKFHPPEIDPFEFFHGSTATAALAGLRDHDLDELLERGRTALDEGERRAAFAEFDRRLREEQYATLLAWPRAAVLLHRRFRGVTVGALGLSPERWWVEPGERVVR